MSDHAEVSICIPTRNRAGLLDRCLQHLASFSGLSLEVIVGDNASVDETQAVVEASATRLPNLRYLRHASDIGFARNMDSVIRRATGKYVYLLSDDDIVFENGIHLMRFVLDANPDVIAVGAPYRSVSEINPGENREYGEVRRLRVGRGDVAGLFKVLSLCDGHPFARREALQRHCSYADSGFGSIPVFSRLLEFGDLCFLNQPVFAHLRNPDSLTTRLAEPWYHDHISTDIEVAAAGAASPPPPEAVAGATMQIHKASYFHAARIALAHEDHATMWRYLRRTKAIGAIDEIGLMQCEKNHLYRVAIDALARRIGDMRPRTVRFEDSPLLGIVRRDLEALLDGWVEIIDDGGADEVDILVREAAPSQNDPVRGSSHYLALADVLDGLRLTHHPVMLEAHEGTARVRFTGADAAQKLRQESTSYKMLTQAYAPADEVVSMRAAPKRARRRR